MTELHRKTPVQERSKQTIETILDAATQVLQVEGEERFTTNRVAEKSGFSMGTLSVFSEEDAIVEALAEREAHCDGGDGRRSDLEGRPPSDRGTSFARACVQPSMRFAGAENCGSSSSSR